MACLAARAGKAAIAASKQKALAAKAPIAATEEKAIAATEKKAAPADYMVMLYRSRKIAAVRQKFGAKRQVLSVAPTYMSRDFV